MYLGYFLNLKLICTENKWIEDGTFSTTGPSPWNDDVSIFQAIQMWQNSLQNTQ